MAKKTTYKVTYERDEDGWWVAAVKHVQGCHTQGRTLAQARQRIREALELFIDNAKTVRLIDDVKLPQPARQVLRRCQSARKRVKELESESLQLTQQAARTLTKELALSVRDAGDLLGLSHQRVHQLLHG
jgi:predicted RNase H-like HicB family nuclease